MRHMRHGNPLIQHRVIHRQCIEARPRDSEPSRGQRGWQRVATSALGSVAIALSLFVAPGLADPFRNSSPRPIDPQAEAAFEALFKQGDYVTAAELLQTASEDEPLTHGMRASIAYLNGDNASLSTHAALTRAAAERLLERDALRGNLYLASANFLEGAQIVEERGLAAATPSVLGKLQQVFTHLRRAETEDPDDPELNLLRGFMDLMLAVNLPFSNPNQAIARFQENAAPSYLVNRGLAIAYRDLDQQESALAAVDQALAETPDNPEMLYLKAQILVRLGRNEESLPLFNQALELREQLPVSIRRNLVWEGCRTTNRVNRIPDEQSRNQCRAVRREA